MKGNVIMKQRMWVIISCLLTTLALLSSASYADEGGEITATLDVGDNVMLYVYIRNCTVYIEPSDGDVIECKYDAGVVGMDYEAARGTQILTLESVTGQRIGYETAATLYVPRDAYMSLEVDSTNSDCMVMKGIKCNHVIYAGDASHISVQYPKEHGEVYYYIGIMGGSTVDLALSEGATDFTFSAELHDSSLNIPVGVMPAYGRPYDGSGEYNFFSGNGQAKIDVIAREGSTLSVLLVRQAD